MNTSRSANMTAILFALTIVTMIVCLELSLNMPLSTSTIEHNRLLSNQLRIWGLLLCSLVCSLQWLTKLDSQSNFMIVSKFIIIGVIIPMICVYTYQIVELVGYYSIH